MCDHFWVPVDRIASLFFFDMDITDIFSFFFRPNRMTTDSDSKDELQKRLDNFSDSFGAFVKELQSRLKKRGEYDSMKSEVESVRQKMKEAENKMQTFQTVCDEAGKKLLELSDQLKKKEAECKDWVCRTDRLLNIIELNLIFFLLRNKNSISNKKRHALI